MAMLEPKETRQTRREMVEEGALAGAYRGQPNLDAIPTLKAFKIFDKSTH